MLRPSVALFLSLPVAAQVAPGDIGAIGFSTNQFGVLTGGTATGYTTPGFQGTGAATSQSILWDPIQPNSFLVGGFGFVGRATITGPGAVSYQLLTNGVGTAAQLSFDYFHNLVIADAGTNQIRRIDAVTSQVTDLTTGAQPWGTSLNAGAFDIWTNTIVVGNNGSIFRFTPATGAVAQVASGLGGSVSWITFDPITYEVVATVLSSNRLVRVSAQGAVADIVAPGTVSSPNAVDYDLVGNWVLASTNGSVFAVPYAGGPATPVGAITTPGTNVSGLSVAYGGGFGTAVPYGVGCAGVGGQVALRADSSVLRGRTVFFGSNNHLPDTLGFLIAGFSDTTYNGAPLPRLLDPQLGTTGCFLHASIDANTHRFTSSNGSLQTHFTIPVGLPATTFFVQHACFEPVPGGLSWSNGLRVTVP